MQRGEVKVMNPGEFRAEGEKTGGCQPVAFLCRQSVIKAEGMVESSSALLLQSQQQTRVPTPFISPASSVKGTSVHSCSPDSAGNTPSVNLPTCLVERRQ